MAHENIYWSDGDNCYTEGEWQRLYPAQRYAFGTVTKETTTDYYDEDSGDSWKKIEVWHWSYWVVLDWVYPFSSYDDVLDDTWTNSEHSLNNSVHRCVSSATSSGTPRVEGDSYNPLREQFVTKTSTNQTTFVQLGDTPYVIHNGIAYKFFEDYVYDESELSPSAHEVRKEDSYSCGLGIENDRGDLWSLNSQGKLTLPLIHTEVLPNTDTPMPTEWRLNENNKLVMPVHRELVNNLGAFSGASNLNTLIIPNSVEALGKKTCRETALSEIILPENCTYYATSFPANCVVTGGQIVGE